MLANAVRSVRARGVQAAQRRMFSGDAHQAHHEATMKQWEKVTKMAIPVVGLLGVYNFVAHFTHHHEHEEKKYSYQNMIKKKFPWSCESCALFDSECWKECKANK